MRGEKGCAWAVGALARGGRSRGACALLGGCGRGLRVRRGVEEGAGDAGEGSWREVSSDGRDIAT